MIPTRIGRVTLPTFAPIRPHGSSPWNICAKAHYSHAKGWLNLAIVLNLYSRRVISWVFSNQPNYELIVRAINLAVQLRQPQQPVLFHTDQGVQYSSDAFRQALIKHNITASMSRRGNCLDNAVTERFFRSLKSERVNYKQYKTRAEGMADVADYIEAFYNQNDAIQH